MEKLINGNPHWEAALIVAQTLEQVGLKYDVDKIEMSLGSVPIETSIPHCGTTACHGGWYAIARVEGGSLFESVDFVNGAMEMAVDLGFNGCDQLKIWANENPKLWGNDNGRKMFSGSGVAFGEDDSTFPFTRIVKHWYNVAERLFNLQEGVV